MNIWPITVQKINSLRELADYGAYQSQAAQLLSMNVSYVSQLNKRYGIFPHAGRGAKIRTEIDPRAETMAGLYRDGATLQEIGDRYSLTRERVRQIMTKWLGISAKDGGHQFRAQIKARVREEAKDRQAMKKHGCTRAQYLMLRNMRKPTRAFMEQKRNAAARGIGWELTLWQWWTIWQQSGKWAMRGRGRGYHMCRLNDVGPYAVDNVYIATGVENMQDYWASDKAAAHPRHGRRKSQVKTEEFIARRRFNVRVGYYRRKLRHTGMTPEQLTAEARRLAGAAA